jgi:MFS transporter, DHA3 family, macrolide efflux protein
MIDFYMKKYPYLFFYLLATLLSKIGNKMYILILPIVVYEFTGSATLMGGTFFFQTLPTIILSPFAGALIDTFSKRKVMITTVIAQMSILSVLVVMIRTGEVGTLLLFSLAFMISSAGIFYSISNESILPEICEKEDLFEINAHFQTIDTLSFMLGPSIAGFIISIWGSELALLVDILSFLPLLAVLIVFKKFEGGNHKVRFTSFSGYWESQKVGWKEIFNHKIILTLLIISTCSNIANGIVESMFVFFAKEELQLSSTTIGLVFTIAALISLVVGLYAKKLTSYLSHRNIILYSNLIRGFGILLIVFSPGWLILSLGKPLFEGPTILTNIVNRTVRQQLIPHENLGKVNAFYRMFVISSFSFSGLIAGFLVDSIGFKYTFLIASGIFFVLFIVLLSNGTLVRMTKMINTQNAS